MRALRTHVPSFVAGLMGAVVGISMLGGAAYAANGGSFLLGKANVETATATLTNTAGTPLALAARAGYAPLKVNSAVKVANLNSDRLDGFDSTSFLRTTGTAYNTARLGGKAESLFALAGGQFAYVDSNPLDNEVMDYNGDLTNDSVIAYAQCPAGSSVVSGGQFQETLTPAPVLASYSYGNNLWVVITAGTASVPGSEAICYNPRGAVTGGSPVK